MRIIVVHNRYQQPGGEDVVFDQERQLLKNAGHEVVPYCRSNWEADSYYRIKRLALARTAIWAADTRRDFVKLLRMQKPDLVHVHNTLVMISPSIYSACRDAGVPVVQTLHNYRLFCPAATLFRNGHICEECIEHTLWRSVRHGCYRDSRPATAAVALMLAVHRARRTWTRDITSYIALSEFARSKFVQGGLPAEKIFIKPNFVHPDPGARDGSGNGDYAIFVGRLAPEKRVGTLLKAWALLGNRVPLLVIGGGPQQRQLVAISQTRGLGSVKFLGSLPHDQTLAAIKRARLLIFASEWYETFGLTMVEAFACGVPVICARLGAMQEIVDHGRTGLHFTAGDAEDLAEKVQSAWNNPERLRLMGKEARQEYENKYTAEKNYPILMRIYEQTLRAPTPSVV